jgi:hypothetical protein
MTLDRSLLFDPFSFLSSSSHSGCRSVCHMSYRSLYRFRYKGQGRDTQTPLAPKSRSEGIGVLIRCRRLGPGKRWEFSAEREPTK